MVHAVAALEADGPAVLVGEHPIPVDLVIVHQPGLWKRLLDLSRLHRGVPTDQQRGLGALNVRGIGLALLFGILRGWRV